VTRSSRGKHARRILIAVAAAVIPLIAGCEAGTNAPSLHWHNPTDGAGATLGNISISNVFVLGAPIGGVIPRGQDAGLFLGLVNVGSSDQLLRISAPGTAASVSLPGQTKQLLVATDQPVLLTGPRPQLILRDLLRPLTGGSVVKIALVFAHAGRVVLAVPVMPRAQYFSTLHPAPVATSPSATPTPSSSASASPTASPSAAG